MRIDRLAVVETVQIPDQGSRGIRCLPHGRPIIDEAAQNGRPLVRQHVAPDDIAVNSYDFADCLRRGHLMHAAL